MKGVQIFVHSVRQVFGNLGDAIKISALPYAIQMLAVFLLLGSIDRTGPEMMSGLTGTFILKLTLVIVVTLVTSMWMAVVWHCFILRNERPTGFIPRFLPNRIWAYFRRTLGIIGIFAILGVAFGTVAGLVTGLLFPKGRLRLMSFMILLYFPLLIIFYRFATALPAAAVGALVSFSAGWDATRWEGGTFAMLAVITILLQLAGEVVDIYVFGGSGVSSDIWNLLFDWILGLVLLSILTTLYGHYIERRELV